MTHSDVIVESTFGDEIFATHYTGIVEQSGIVNTLNMVPGGTPAMKPFQTDRAGKLWLARRTGVVFANELKQIFRIFEMDLGSWN